MEKGLVNPKYPPKNAQMLLAQSGTGGPVLTVNNSQMQENPRKYGYKPAVHALENAWWSAIIVAGGRIPPLKQAGSLRFTGTIQARLENIKISSVVWHCWGATCNCRKKTSENLLRRKRILVISPPLDREAAIKSLGRDCEKKLESQLTPRKRPLN